MGFELANRRIFVAGHGGMVGSALVRRLRREEYTVLTVERAQIDLREQQQVREWFARERPDVVFLAAATVGGIHANNTLRAQFIYDNLMIAANVIDAAHAHSVCKLMFLGSSCIYPRLASQPMAEEVLLDGRLEPTNEPYAIAKIAGIKLAESYRRQYGDDFISVMPTNLYGPGDNYHPENSHVVPALLRRFHEAKMQGCAEVVVWGTGQARREFLYVDDLADACIHLMRCYSDTLHVNIGTGEDVTIEHLAGLIARVTGYAGTIAFDKSRPDGAPRKLLDVSRLAGMGWRPSTSLQSGLALTYQSFLENRNHLRT
jgi:GDP-L-fucose synthase